MSAFGLAGVTLISAWLSAPLVQAASTIRFAAENYAGAEGSVVGIHLPIDPPLTADAHITVAQTGGTASAADTGVWFSVSFHDREPIYSGPGYTIPAAIDIPAGATNVFVQLSLYDDGLPESEETLELALTNPSGGLVLGEGVRSTVTIRNAVPRFGLVSSYSSESEGFVTIGSYRSGDTNVAFTVDYFTVANGTALPGVNFVPTNGTLTILAGEHHVTFEIPVINDGVVAHEGYKTFGVQLTNLPAGIEITTTPVKVWIYDSQWPTTLDLSYRPEVWGGPTDFTPNGQVWLVGSSPLGDTQLVRLSADGVVEARLPAITDGFIQRLIIQPDGKILLLGSEPLFSSFNGVAVPRPGFARVLPDGRLDTNFVPAVMPPATVGDEPLLLANGDLLVSDGNSLHRLRPDGQSTPGFQVADMAVQALAEDAQGRLLVAREIATDDGLLAKVERLDANGVWDPGFDSGRIVGTIRKLLPQSDGKTVVAGRLASVNGLDRGNLVRLETDGTLDETFDAGAVSQALSLYDSRNGSADIVLNGDKLLVVFPWEGVCRLNADGSLDRRFPVRFDGEPPSVSKVKLQDGRLLIAGNFWRVNGISTPGLARLLLDEAPESTVVIAPKLDQYWEESDPSGYEGMGEAEIALRRLGDVRQPAIVSYATRDGSAKAGQDYESVTGTLTFAPFELEKSFRLPILDDAEVERQETLELQLKAGSGVTVVDGRTRFTLHDDEVTSEIQLAGLPGTPRCLLMFNKIPGRHYVIERSTDLRRWQSWNRYDTTGDDRAGVISIEADLSSPRHFFRVR